MVQIIKKVKQIMFTDRKKMAKVISFSLFTDFDIALFKAGKHFKLYEKLGSHPAEVDGVKGTYFAVWAPSAKSVSVIGDFNYWNDQQHKLFVRWDASGIWEGFIKVGKRERTDFGPILTARAGARCEV